MAASLLRVLAFSLVLTLTSAGCGVKGEKGEAIVVTETVATVTGGPAQGGVDVPAASADALSASTAASPASPVPFSVPPEYLNAVVSGVPGPAGLAVAPVGGAEQVVAAGSWQSGVAWSTIKIPLAVAVARSDPQALEMSTSAVTVSDNQAAESLWATLGGGDEAASAVEAVLAEGGDTVSDVPSVHTRAGYSVFGQTRWSLVDQARFMSSMPCLDGAGRVVDLMGQITPGQQWGLGRIPGARFKGGWGPGETGGYLVRQFGLVPGGGGDVAVALAVEAPTFEAGTTALTSMADELAQGLAAMPGGRC